ncbi:DNA translocase FtsK [Deinococcus sp. 14RED07]|uniref:DNA translocase FtsK n=1 Tax=Deinococcus sp. 14RED07 TaxID=2745874 RepID=UPI001E61E193|nr:DNA translocase FtsK [Deinococcus sp. 14RED07]MCD0174453.1 DNA translocase FtsK [Deinococcus sp. 14RED07]
MTTPTLTRAILLVLRDLLTTTVSNQRSFVRLNGFDEATYFTLLGELRLLGDKLSDRQLLVRTTGHIHGFDGYAMEAEKSPTWYRNNVPPTHALVLISNTITSDAQSLKDLFTVDEATLAQPNLGLPHLLTAAFQTFTLTPDARKELMAFVARLNRIRKPQVRSLAAFFDALNTELTAQPGLTIRGAIGLHLPELGLFRCADLATTNAQRSDRLLQANITVAALGGELLEPARLDTYLNSVQKHEALFEDEGARGLTPQVKAALLRRFLTGVLSGDDLRSVLQLDWRDVEPVLYKPTQTTAKAKRQALGLEVKAHTQTALPGDLTLSGDAQEALDDLLKGTEPAPEHVQALVNELGSLLPKRVGAALARLARPARVEGHDFVLDVLRALISMLHPRPEGAQGQAAQVTVTADEPTGPHSAQAAEAFLILYGGLSSLLAHITWAFDALRHVPEDLETTGVSSLRFRIEVMAGPVKDSTELLWHFDPNGFQGAAVEHLRTAVRGGPAVIPVLTAAHSVSPTHIDLQRPHESLGAYHTSPQDLRALLTGPLPSWVGAAVSQQLLTEHAKLEAAWDTYVRSALSGGLLSASTSGLLDTYDSWMRSFLEGVRQPNGLRHVMPLIARAWTITGLNDDSWAVVPFIHPFKLHWWQERHRALSAVIGRILTGSDTPDIIDEPRFLQGLDGIFGSSGAPGIVGLKLPSQHARYLAPAHAEGGYELFVPIKHEEENAGTSDARTHAAYAAKEMARVIEDYIETYPFVLDGLEVYLVECRNVALPGLLADHLVRVAERRKWKLKCTIVAHSPNEGAALYRDVQRWVREHEEALMRRADAYFPDLTLRVVEVPFHELMQNVSETDIAILADVIGTRGQEVQDAIVEGRTIPLEGLLTHAAQGHEPHQAGHQDRSVPLTAKALPQVAHRHLLVQYAAYKGQDVTRRMAKDDTVQFSLNVSLDQWRTELNALHETFNWIICYDTVVDRYLLESNFPDAVQVIRYSMGIGPDRAHKLTVSSSRKVQRSVTRRLSANLTSLIPTLPSTVARDVAQALVDAAKEVSGDIVLRAAGPGAYLNEILGMVTAKATVEGTEVNTPGVLRTWLYLDDFPHWFKGKIPDLLRLSLRTDDAGHLQVDALVVETKCIEDASFDREAQDAQLQVRAGATRLARVWAPGSRHLDAPYWYDQLAQALAGTMRIEFDDLAVWNDAVEALTRGAFTLHVRGETHVYCHNGMGSLTGRTHATEDFTAADPIDGTIPMTAHHYARPGFLNRLRRLAEHHHVGVTEATWRLADEQVQDTVELKTSDFDGSSGEGVAVPGLDVTQLLDETRTEPEPASDDQTVTPQDGHDPALHNWLTLKAQQMDRLLRQYGFSLFPIRVEDADVGATIVRFKVRLHPGQELSKLQRQAENLARDLASPSIPFIDNVLGSPFVGIDIAREIPTSIPLLPWLQELSVAQPGALPVILGQTPDGRKVEEDLSEFPHLLVAGATNSGKSVFLRNLVLCLIATYGPNDLKLLIVDPKQTDFSFFETLPHLIGGKVITSQEEARDRLLALVKEEMPRRQQVMRGRSLKIKDFNARYPAEALPPVVAIIDEYAQLLSIMGKKDRDAFERDLMSLAAVARATGIHLIIATQRPSADVVTGTLKANLPARIAFKVAAGVDSRIVLDTSGAENLLGRGDMLYRKSSGEVIRLQAPYLSEEDLLTYIRSSALETRESAFCKNG